MQSLQILAPQTSRLWPSNVRNAVLADLSPKLGPKVQQIFRNLIPFPTPKRAQNSDDMLCPYKNRYVYDGPCAKGLGYVKKSRCKSCEPSTNNPLAPCVLFSNFLLIKNAILDAVVDSVFSCRVSQHGDEVGSCHLAQLSRQSVEVQF